MQQIPTPKQRKASKQKKIAPLLTGNPGDFPLDQPLPSFHPPTELQIQDHNPTALNSSLLDIPEPPLLQSFLEPLDTLLNEDMDDRFQLFETIHSDIIITIQNHFNLLKTTANNKHQ
ncbi:hypothetical protein NPIL_492341 [Nephila pilipes]|uniref:Uncharacterized protein n=1 Tax=Nephila pilipes TaxID=299642 RepID=A0A8X6MTN3_NEPPI|nr:hypothetical protein NPIL_492341 [Nephila pilipes]